VAICDVTEQRRAERDRDRNQKFLNTIIENIPITIFVKEPREQRYILVNRAAEQLWESRATRSSARPRTTYFQRRPRI